MSRGGVTSFSSLVGEVGDNSTVDGKDALSAKAPAAGPQAVRLSELVANPYNPRDSVGDLDELASIVDVQLQPAVVVTRKAFLSLFPDAAIAAGAKWVVVIGNRRLAAARKFGRPKLDIVVKDELARDRATLLTAVISENVDRKGFDVIEEAKAVERLVQECGSADAARASLRKSNTWISERRVLLKLPAEMQESLRRGDLAIREARELARVPREEQVERWNARNGRRGGAGGAAPGAGESGTGTGAASPPARARSLSRVMRKFDTEPNALAVALHGELGDAGTKTLVSLLRKLVK